MPAHINPDAVRTFYNAHIDDTLDGAFCPALALTAINFGLTEDLVCEIVSA